MSTAFKTRTRGFFAMIMAIALAFSCASVPALAAEGPEDETMPTGSAVAVDDVSAMPELAILPTSVSVAEGGEYAGKYSDNDPMGSAYLVDGHRYRMTAGFTGLNGATGSVRVKVYAIGSGGLWSACNVKVPVDGRAHAYEFKANWTGNFLIELVNETGGGDFIYSIMIFKI